MRRKFGDVRWMNCIQADGISTFTNFGYINKIFVLEGVVIHKCQRFLIASLAHPNPQEKTSVTSVVQQKINPIPILFNQLTTKRGFKPLQSADISINCEDYDRGYRKQQQQAKVCILQDGDGKRDKGSLVVIVHVRHVSIVRAIQDATLPSKDVQFTSSGWVYIGKDDSKSKDEKTNG